ncbi:winged helix-turn-helix domain-containing protein [Streptomyces sp. NPDC047028]|uniref:winged helix-turn-helix domain-containing protein n=1 Tax=Streptomyces sp. NPDC047028 TaxID=3155793 RepID=UPI0033CDCC34
MTMALPSPTSLLSEPSAPRLRIAPEPTTPSAQDGTPPLAAYLVLLPADTDPAAVFARTGLRPHIRAVALDELPAPAPLPDGGEHPAGGPVRIDTSRHVALLDGHELDLTYLEFGLLARLVDRPGQVHSREQLVRSVWGHEHIGDGRTVDVHVARLRRKLGTAHRHRIITVRRVGYKYVPDA